ncbi:OprO/OprP family phosphate-selective porin [Aquisalimonas asiatica]|uniref:Phosphate-selective porin OprO and OprP n=1 Tax=Aquisalimonas asiatica TaxID=406100 RepID=A0A1H8RRQ9_9GAMM|nr:porin [Aquisalimonas asiatica]SEO69026.1 phosphate-selective porin OprO and OprP [Aquisalimonas asiatica]
MSDSKTTWGAAPALAIAAVLAVPLAHADTGAQRFAGLDYEPMMDVSDDPVRTRVNKFRVETEDGKHRFGIRGRLMTDYAFVQDPFTSTDDEDADDGDLARYGTIIRRARLGALGVMYDNWEWQLEVDFRDDEVRFANAYMAYLFDNGRLAVGHFKEPFSLESSTSSRRISFIERAAPVDAYRPSRQIGLMYETLVPDYYAAIGAFGGDGVARDRDVTEGYSLAARASFAPVFDAEQDLWSHLGVSANYRANAYEWDRSGGDQKEYESVRMRTRLGTRAVDGRMIGENDMENVKDFTTVALEGGFGVGPFSVQGEYIRQDLNRDSNSDGFDGEPGDDVTSMTSEGYYVQTSYFLTGETRNYRPFSGDFGATRIQSPLSAGGRGAWEVLARFATADSYEHHNREDRQKLDHYTLGLNWYPEDDIVLKLNVMYVDAQRGEDGFGDGRKDWDSMVYAARFQFEF